MKKLLYLLLFVLGLSPLASTSCMAMNSNEASNGGDGAGNNVPAPHEPMPIPLRLTPVPEIIAYIQGHFNNLLYSLLQNAYVMDIADPQDPSRTSLLANNIYLGATPLHWAAFCGNEKAVNILLSFHRHNIDTHNSTGISPLHAASIRGLDACIKILLKHGAKLKQDEQDKNKQEKDKLDILCQTGETCLQLAVKQGDRQSIKTLLKYHAHALVKHGDPQDTLLHLAAGCGRTRAIKPLIRHTELKIDNTNTHGHTACHLAVEHNVGDVLQKLFKYGANLNAQDNGGETPLYRAAHLGNHTTVQWLLEKGADHGIADTMGQTPLHIAAATDKELCVIILLQHGANTNAEDDDKCTPSEGASESCGLIIQAYDNPQQRPEINNECICGDEFKESGFVAQMNCGHVFHVFCYHKQLETAAEAKQNLCMWCQQSTGADSVTLVHYTPQTAPEELEDEKHNDHQTDSGTEPVPPDAKRRKKQ